MVTVIFKIKSHEACRDYAADNFVLFSYLVVKMSLSLLKTVWRNVHKNNPLSMTSVHSRTCTSNSFLQPPTNNVTEEGNAGSEKHSIERTTQDAQRVPEMTRMSTPDALSARLQAAPSAGAVLAAVQDALPGASAQDMLQALRSLFTLHRAGKIDKDTEELIKDPAFNMLCQNFKKRARALDVNEAIEATKVLSYLRVPVDSLIVQTMLQLVRTNINNLNIRQIMFLDFILGRYDTKNHLIDALKLALPLAFQIHLAMEIDNEDMPLLRDMLYYCCTHNLPDRCINNVVTGLLLHDQAIDAQAAKSIIWSLFEVNCTAEIYPTRVQLLHICCDILGQSINELSYEEVLRTAARLKGRILEKHPEYYHEPLMDATANYVVENNVDFEKGLLIGRVLSRIAHTHLGLVSYLCQVAVASPETLSNARTNILFGFINCLANNNYSPEPATWEEITKRISQNPILDAKNAALPWTKLCLELASLGYYDDRLLKRVFSTAFLEEFLARPDNTLDYLQLLTLYEAVNTFHSQEYDLPPALLRKARSMYPTHALTEQLEMCLARGIGARDHVTRNVALPSGIVADVFMCLKAGYPVKLDVPHDRDEKLPLEELDLPPGCLPVCLMNFNQGCFSMNSNRLRGTFRLVLDVLDKQGFAAVAVNVSEWASAPPHEQTPYLMREVGYKCGELGMKLGAT